VLGIGIKDAEDALEELEGKVQTLLKLRQLSTIHKDGSVTIAARDVADFVPPAPEPDPFSALVVQSDDEPAAF
jgi:hypothetical protein